MAGEGTMDSGVNPDEGSPLLIGVVGSRAYGMNRPDSDTDRLGVFAAPTVAFHGLHPPTGKAATIARHEPDVTMHEAAKMAALCLNGNPTVLELLWLPDYELTTPLGRALVEIRSKFLSAVRVRNAYLGYATQQFQKLTDKGRFPDVPVDRIRKHAVHLMRLVDQGCRLWVTGEIVVRVEDPGAYFEFADRVVADPTVAEGVLARAALTYRTLPTVLPDEPDTTAVEEWLLAVRAHHYRQQGLPLFNPKVNVVAGHAYATSRYGGRFQGSQ